MAIEWRTSYEIGVKQIDMQHKALFDKINDLLEACNSNKGKEEVINTINFLGDYVVTHFADEEKLQRESGYPEYAGHKAAHDKFVKDYESLKTRFEQEGISLNFVFTVNKVIVDWLIKHIGNADKAFGDFLKAKG
ncbi:bacteriohemerythrin [Acetivibrio clariflavus]|uniref:Hemerythrin-like metal-binding domain-containing protein n=1 Tax=Acetivibrio clariflavus (strain DSM 19732 / NBRC 101661 / EBR45) TaxID=720554 RepID=G8LST7_ACECE|nr:bacteriohemerythrin [Acetivibrio clariflavus]AEV70450.1 hemerythrin-like metal-binding domain-containing protein [Acetivibrio clariflavus DSM 19732]